jgi:asparagine synthase (glutamine-hydrolysing)
MIAVGFAVSAGPAGLRVQTYSDPPELAERMISVARRGPVTLVLLGRIYYQPQSDAAFAAQLYEQGGLAALEQLDGDFVLVAHDARAHRLVALRSPAGAYPLFWLQSGETFAIAPSIRPLLEHLAELRIDEEYVADYLAYPIASLMELPSERTAYRDVQRLLAGWSLELNLATRNVQRRRYWDWSAHVETHQPATIEEAER